MLIQFINMVSQENPKCTCDKEICLLPLKLLQLFTSLLHQHGTANGWCTDTGSAVDYLIAEQKDSVS